MFLRMLYINVNAEVTWGDWVKVNEHIPEEAVRKCWNVGSIVAVQLSADANKIDKVRAVAYTYTQAGVNSLRRYNHNNHRTDTVLI